MSDPFTSGVVSGIVSGLATAILFWIARFLWVHGFLPWFENRIYKDVRIEGKWISRLTSLDDFESILIKQVGHRVEGRADCFQGPDAGSSYLLKGDIRNKVLTMSYWSEDKSALDRGTFTIKLTRNGRKFEGRTAWYRDDDEAIAESEYIWVRDELKYEIMPAVPASGAPRT